MPSFALGLALLAALSGGRSDYPSARNGKRSSTPSAEAREAYGRIPLSFEANRGQTDAAADFLARGAGYQLFLRPTEAVFVLSRPQTQEAKNSDPAAPAVLRMALVGANASAAEAVDELPGKANYLIGNDPAEWRTNVPTFGRVRYREIYPGIAVSYYGNQRQLEYDFEIAPGADPGAVNLRFDGADKVEIDANGELLLTLGESVLRQPKPFIYQEVGGIKRAIEGGYVVADNGRVGFALGQYDASLPLVIDPILVYSTYLGGTGGDQAWDVAVDSSGNAYLAGFTTSTNFPTANPIQAMNGGFQDAFVTKLNAAGTALVYSTYLGGGGTDQARGIAIDSAGNAYVTGFTGSTNFPTANAFQSAQGAGNSQDVFFTKLNASGTALVYSSYLGGDGALEFGESIAVDSAGNAYLTGVTNSTNFPLANAIQAAHAGGGDVFITKVNAAGNALVYSTYLGGSDFEIAENIALDSAGSAYVTGDTRSTNYPTLSPIQAANAGGQDGFVSKVNAAGNALVYSTYLGGSADDQAEAVAVDSAGNAYLTGTTNSTNFPTANAFQPANGGTSIFQDAFVTKLNAAGTAFVYSTYLGGTGGEVGHGIAVDSAGNAYVTGGTGSNTTFPTVNAIQCYRAGGADVFITMFNAAGNALVYSTYLGGSGSGTTIEIGRSIAVDSSGNAYVVGGTDSTDFPTANPLQSTYGDSDIGLAGDAFALKLSAPSAMPASSLQFSQTTHMVNEDVTSLNLTVTRGGTLTDAATVNYATANGTASERSDYTTAVGTLHFAPGQTSANITILVNEDSYSEGTENFTVTLSNATGAAISCPSGIATVQITDDAVEPTTNVIDDPAIFVGQHYHDFLNRDADAAGRDFWTAQLTSCGGDAQCMQVQRVNVSRAFFASIEFQRTGYFVFRLYKETFTDSAQRPRGMPRYREFLRDTQEVSRGVVVGSPGWEATLEANKQAFAQQWVQRAEFVSLFPLNMTASQFVDKLFFTAGVVPSQAERDEAIAAFGGGGVNGRAAALRNVAESRSVYNRQFNEGFVLIEYIGYLRRNPDDAPDNSYAGFDFWLNKMNQAIIPGDDVRNEQDAMARESRAEMVRAFIESIEYRQRFGPP